MSGVVRVAVRVKPGVSRLRVGGHHPGPYGPALVIAVGAPAVNGKATEAARRALAAALGVRRGEVTLRRGAASRDKVFSVAVAEPAIPHLLSRIEQLRDSDVR